MTITHLRATRTAFEADWASLCERYAAPPLPAWAGAGVGEDACDLAEWSRRAADSDALVAGALRAAQAGERDAGRAVLHLLLPRLVGLACRDAHHELADYLAAAWLRLMDFPVERRPHALLTNLALDTLKHLSRTYERQHRAVSVRLESPRPDTEPLNADALITRAGRAGWLAPASVPVLRSVYCDGLTGREAASRHATSPEMVRYRCSTGVKALRAHRDELLLAA